MMTAGEQQHSAIRISHLIQAYLNLESTANREISSATAAKIEAAMAVIQLLGTVKQIQLAQDFINQFVKSRSGSYDALLEELRQDIRAGLGLEARPGISLIRIGIPETT